MMKEKRSGLRIKYKTQRQLNAFLFVLPWVIGFLFFFLIPLLQTLVFSFNTVGVADKGGYVLENVGTANYIQLFTEEVTTQGQQIIRMLMDVTGGVFINTPITVIFSLFLALLVNKKFRGRGVVRTIFFLPIILGLDVVVNLLAITTGMGASDVGSSNVFAGFSIASFIVRYTGLPVNMIDGIMNVVNSILVWVSQTGVQTLVYLAALQSISPSFYEVADIEGATAYEKFWKVTIPSIKNITFFIIVYTVVTLFLRSSIAEEVYYYAFTTSKIGIGSALSVVYIFNVLIVLLFVFIVFGRREKIVNVKTDAQRD